MFRFNFKFNFNSVGKGNINKYMREYNDYKAYVISQGGTIQDERTLKQVFKQHQ